MRKMLVILVFLLPTAYSAYADDEEPVAAISLTD
ncbi:MAG: hypothetical protein CFH21_00593 [Alphaproteobacteria bacterium MarineAlpha5_Bin11]|nr:MAG: hypothetical protein CFH21_00593 [Alphaproteobacteria bacterium MarineAlpha5_Bin11]